MRCVFLGLLALMLGSVAGSARADATQAQLVWSAPDASVCARAVPREAIEREVEQLVGHPIFVATRAEADVVLRGGIAAATVGVRAWFEARDVAGNLVGKRELSEDTGDCTLLQHSAALVLSVLLDRPRREGGEPSPEPSEHADHRVSVSAGAAVSHGSLPRLAPGLWLALEIRLSSWLRVRTDGAYWRSITQRVPARPGATMSAFTGGLALCPGWSSERTRMGVGACLGGQLGAVVASPLGLVGPDRAARLLAQATLEVGASLRLQRLTTVFVAAGPTVALTRPRFYYTTEDAQVDVYRPRAYGIIARIGLTIGAP